MEGETVSENQTSSYTYWVREATSDAAPLPLPKKLSSHDISNKPSQTPLLGSVWNTAGTWEEKNLNKWATDRIKAYLVTVRNKKRVGYSYELTIDVKGEWLVGEEKKEVKGILDIPEFSYGELDELEVKVKINEGNELPHLDKQSISKDLKCFLQPLREKLSQFEQELKQR
ncbi:hypothetical protein RDABS01_038407 [Bienertia sinuspersici]